MKWESLGEFLAMGGYGLYVWGAYIMTFVAVAAEIILLAVRHRAARKTRQAP